MIWLAILALVVVIGASIVRGLAYDDDVHFGAGAIRGVALIAVLLFGSLSLFERQEFGTVKVGTLWGDVQDTQLNNGINFPVNPFVSWTEYNVQLHTQEFTGNDAFECLSKDDKEFFIEANASHRMVPESAWWVKENLKDVESLVRGAIRTGPRKATAVFDLMAMNENTAELEKLAVKAANDAIRENMIETYFRENPEDVVIPYVVTKYDFRKPELPQSIQEAITLKFAKQQEAEAMQFVLDKERKEAERKEIEAQGIADFQRIVTEGINERLLYWRYIEVMRELAGSENTTFIFAPDGRDNPFQILVPTKDK